MKTIELTLNKGCNREKVITTLKMLRDSGLLISLHQYFLAGVFHLIATYQE